MKGYYGNLEKAATIKYKGYIIEHVGNSVELMCEDGCIGGFRSVAEAKRFVDKEISENIENYNNAVMAEYMEMPLYSA